ncbi:roadblock/LC7 domain-containing protein [Egibacter rhizosphaerae]|uniref:Roadblock/LC7 domain-containing protein n=1 Tax=Egibacter rhizosphaerae TaxID=1670831 RepID=A0A411YLR4_9ACTN|nr:roadblock/LC7 domain-containing protein [Egibacter rhizosphaerae]QBI22159.1 roadblock/LC7 domain-containing protein [Egibacter rhizosphaerae]
MTGGTHATQGGNGLDLDWIVANFAERVPEVIEAIVVSADGLLIARSPGLDRDTADQFSAIASGMLSLGRGAARTFDGGTLNDIIVQLDKGYLFVTRVSDASGLAVVASRQADAGLVAHEMGLVAERLGGVLTPALIAQLRSGIGVGSRGHEPSEPAPGGAAG